MNSDGARFPDAICFDSNRDRRFYVDVAMRVGPVAWSPQRGRLLYGNGLIEHLFVTRGPADLRQLRGRRWNRIVYLGMRERVRREAERVAGVLAE